MINVTKRQDNIGYNQSIELHATACQSQQQQPNKQTHQAIYVTFPAHE